MSDLSVNEYESYVENLNEKLQEYGGDPVSVDLHQPSDEMELRWLQQDIEMVIEEFLEKDSELNTSDRFTQSIHKLHSLKNTLIENQKHRLSQ